MYDKKFWICIVFDAHSRVGSRVVTDYWAGYCVRCGYVQIYYWETYIFHITIFWVVEVGGTAKSVTNSTLYKV